MTQKRTMTDRYMLRLPDGWRDVIKEESRKAHRSMNAEIVAAIETAMRIKGVQLDAPAQK
ncbi:Arc family DNA-binding protein [Pseudodonghicola flavimaris]|uniref:Arc family DNA-binding protein n=1 Tax=Pseudodonghicola flavimaris TaxID=3050036 RepID=A0ABT7F8R0_9RHOB|nr:Arc family DNA-binding protein [Pseudodonghicola flavimaris]MDK3020958.1 Arc family DNA-binding protein [Pseudodonghicola flavimaris]